MKFSILNFRKNKTPALSSLRPALFNINSHWFASLGLFFVALIATALIASKLFYLVYSESFKKETPKEALENLIDAKKLKASIEKRIDFIMTETSLPKDPAV